MCVFFVGPGISGFERQIPAASKEARVVTQFISDLGKPLGSPWTQDEKFATLAAWLAHIEKR
jgi:hypothetical protein